MRVLYDYPSFIPTYGGVPRYVSEILKVLQNEIEIDMSVLYSDNTYLEQLPFVNIHHLITKKKFKGKDKIEGIINLLYSSYKIIRNNYDIFHATYSNTYIMGFSNSSYFNHIKKPVVTTIHDMIYENLPEQNLLYAKNIESKKKLIYNSNHIIAVSENTKKEILEKYPINPEKITVIYHGAPSIPQKTVKNEFGKYILFVGRRSPYKNFPFFVESIAPLLLEDQQLKLVCVSPSFSPAEEKFLTELQIRHQVLAISASEDLLNSLYQNALVFVFPSIREGFGIPILEAFANNCPVCLSDTSCFPEIAGNAAYYFDPKDKLSIYTTVKKVITDKELASELIKLGLKRLPLFSWAQTAKQTFEVYKNVVSSEKNFKMSLKND